MTRAVERPQPKEAGGSHLPGDSAMWVMVLGDLVIFGAYFVIFMIYRTMAPEQFLAAQQHLNITVGVVNTVVLLSSSWFIARSVLAARAGDPAALGAVPNYVAQTLWPAGGITDGACGSVWRAIQYDRVAPGPEPDHPPVSQRVRPASTRRPVGRDGVTPVTGAALMRPADGPSADGRSTRRCTRRATCPDDASVHIRARVAAAPSRDKWARRHAGARVDRVWPPQIRGHGVLWRHTDARPAIGPPQHDEGRDARPGVRAGRGTPWHRSRLRTPSIASTAPTGRRWAG